MPSPEGQNPDPETGQLVPHSSLRELIAAIPPPADAETQHEPPKGEMITIPESVRALAGRALGETVKEPENTTYVREVETIPEDKITTATKMHAVGSPFIY